MKKFLSRLFNTTLKCGLRKSETTLQCGTKHHKTKHTTLKYGLHQIGNRTSVWYKKSKHIPH